MRIKKAFTLIELLVVIAIIALLLSIVIPSVAKAKDYAKRTICMNGLRQTGLGLRLYAEDNDGHVMPNYDVGSEKVADPPSFMPDPYNSYMVYLPGKMKADGVSYKPFHLAVLYDLGYIEIPEIFYCPAQPRATVGYSMPFYYDFYVGKGNVSDYHSSSPSGAYSWGEKIPIAVDHTNPRVRTSFNYWVYGKSRLDKISGYKAIVFDNIQEWEVVPHRKGRGVDSRPQGLSALYVDGHVNFCNDSEIFDDQYWPRQDGIGNGPGNNRDSFERILKLLNGK